MRASMILINTFIIIASYIISAYSTTDISRLLSGTKQSYLSFNSYCHNCRHPLSLIQQIPIFSFYFCKGKCRYCAAPIPLLDHFLETGLFIFFTLVNLVFSFTYKAFILCLLGYELLKILLIIIKRPTQNKFLKHCLLSALMNLVIFTLYAFLYLIHSLV